MRSKQLLLLSRLRKFPIGSLTVIASGFHRSERIHFHMWHAYEQTFLFPKLIGAVFALPSAVRHSFNQLLQMVLIRFLNVFNSFIIGSSFIFTCPSASFSVCTAGLSEFKDSSLECVELEMSVDTFDFDVRRLSAELFFERFTDVSRDVDICRAGLAPS